MHSEYLTRLSLHDPLSVAASAVAFIQAAAAIGKGVQALRSLGNLPAEIHGLSNDLTALQTLGEPITI
jgi:hypothetical protein